MYLLNFIFAFQYFYCTHASWFGLSSSHGQFTKTVKELDPLEKYDILRGKVRNITVIPLYEFGIDMQKIINDLENNGRKNSDSLDFMISEMDLQILFTEYINIIQGMYLMQFMKALETAYVDVEATQQLRNNVFKECRAAMRSAVPSARVGQWEYEGPLEELSVDMNRHIDEITRLSDSDVGPTPEGLALGGDSDCDGGGSTSRRRRGLGLGLLDRLLYNRIRNRISPKWRKRVKWLGVQCCLLGVNFLQNEWQRRSVVWSCERRLAEVSEFPLM